MRTSGRCFLETASATEVVRPAVWWRMDGRDYNMLHEKCAGLNLPTLHTPLSSGSVPLAPPPFPLHRALQGLRQGWRAA